MQTDGQQARARLAGTSSVCEDIENAPVTLDSRFAWTVLAQAARFAGVGGLATAIHVVTFLGVSELTGMPAIYANFVAFLCAFAVSFAGHLNWTFRAATDDRRATRRMLLRFLIVALIGLALNSLIVFVTVDVLGHSRMIAAALMATVVPASTFLLSRHWAFA